MHEVVTQERRKLANRPHDQQDLRSELERLTPFVRLSPLDERGRLVARQEVEIVHEAHPVRLPQLFECGNVCCRCRQVVLEVERFRTFQQFGH